jgi:hypothetical protein
LSKRGLHIDLIEHFQHDAIGCRLPVGRYGQVGPHYERHPIGGIVAHDRVVAGRLAAVEIQRVRSEAQLGDAVPVLLAVGLARVQSALNTLPPTSAWIQVTRSLAVEMTPPAAEAYKGFWLVSSLGLSVPALAAAWISDG